VYVEADHDACHAESKLDMAAISPSRLPASTHIGTVRLQVADLERSIAYYTTLIGLRVLSSDDGTAVLGPHGDDTSLVALREKRGVARAPLRGAFGLFHFAILMPDRAALGRFAEHLTGRAVRVGMADHLVSEALYLTDPDGLGIEVYADRPRERWQYVGGELAMTTEPLDIASVIRSGRGEPWRGAPAGTTIGHMHLHVGDLDRASAFYHSALGLDRMVWSYPGALFMSAGGYHHHLGTNTWSPGPSANDSQARLLEWELVVPAASDASVAARNLRAAGFDANETDSGWTVDDPWGTRLRIVER